MEGYIMKVLIGCEFSQVVTTAFRNKGHEAYSCDLIPTEGNTDWHIQDDVLDVIGDGWDLAIFHPPCTFLAVSGNRWMNHPLYPNRENDRESAIEFFMQLANADIERIAIENPVGVMSTRWRKPNQYIQPYQFGHPEPKKTGLWLKNLPMLVPTKIVEPTYIIGKDGNRYSPTHYMTKWSAMKRYGTSRESARSRTFKGISEAFADQWGC